MTSLPAIESRNYLTPQEAASLLEINLSTVHDWKERGILPYKKWGGRLRLDKTTVLQILERGATE